MGKLYSKKMYFHTNLSDTQCGESWWSYRNYPEETLTKLDNYLTQVPRDVGLDENLFTNMEKLCKTLGLNLHPVFAYPDPYLWKAYPQEIESSDPNPQNGKPADNKNAQQVAPIDPNSTKALHKVMHMQYVNCKIDSLTMKMF